MFIVKIYYSRELGGKQAKEITVDNPIDLDRVVSDAMERMEFNEYDGIEIIGPNKFVRRYRQRKRKRWDPSQGPWSKPFGWNESFGNESDGSTS